MKKFLISTIAVSLVATMMGVLVACGDDTSNNDADTATKAITSVRQLYGDKATETPVDYEVNGTQKVGSKLYTITWTVSSSYTDYANYITVGKMDDNNKVTIGITQTDDVIEYKLKASVTVGKATKSTEFNRKVPAKAAGHEGTEADPYEVANVKEIGAKLASGSYYEIDGAAKMVWVKGYVVDAGTPNASAGRVNNVYIVDEYSADKDKNSTDAQQVYSITYDNTVLTGQYPLGLGDLIVVKGFIQNYNGTLEITYKGNDSVFCTSLTPAEDTRTAEQKVNAAVNGITLAANKYTATGEVTLPVSSVRGVTLSWAVKETSEYATVTGNTLNIASLPDTATSVVLVATATLDGTDTSVTKDFTITLEKGDDLGLEHAGTQADPYSIADINKIFAKIGENATYQVNGADKEVYVKGYVTNGGTVGTSRLNNAYIADTAGATQAQSALVYGLDWDDEMLPEGTTLTVGDQVVIKGYLKDYKGTDEIAQTGSGSTAVFPKLVSLTEATDDRTPAEKVAAVKTALTLETSYSTAGKVNLPASTVRGVTVTWASNNTAVIAIAEDNKSMTITLPDTATEVKVTATIACGTDATDTKEFTITVSKDVVYDGEGTLDNPYSVADVQKILNSLAKNASYNDESGAIKQVYFTGYVTVAGTAGSYGYNNVYVGATADATQANSVLVYSLNWDTTVWVTPNKLYVGDQVTVRGYLKNYNGTKEVADNGATTNKDYPVLVARTEVVRDDARKIADALAAVSASLANITAAGDTTLPTSTEAGVTFVWSIKDNDGKGVITLSEDGTKITATLPSDEDKTVTLVVTASCGTATPVEKEVTVKVKKEETMSSKSLSFTVAANRTSIDTSTSQVWEANGVKFTNGKGTGNAIRDNTNDGHVRCYQNSTVKVEYANMKKIVFHATSGYAKVAESIGAVEGVTVTTDGNDIIVTFDTAKDYFEFTCSAQLRFTSIDVYYETTEGGDEA
ncbi:MAG: hypothetical protein K2M47_04750 [Clostridiales bacterium]|nr:hypothetical protein [Clostridiales bacterium]